MQNLIIKRDGSLANFDKQRIINAINKAFIEVDGSILNEEIAQEIADDIEEMVNGFPNGSIEVEEIQDMVEDGLMDSERKDVAKAYIRYRYKRSVARNAKDDFIKAIREKLDATNIENQNANIDEKSFGGRTGEASEVVTKQLALDYIVSPMARKNHIENRIYIHDLGSYYVGSHNCLSIPFDDLLTKGFKARQTDVRPASSVATAFQLLAVIFQLQSLNQFGGVSSTHLDWTMVPYVRKSFSKHMKDGLRYIENIKDEEYINSVPKELKFDDLEANDVRHSKAYKYAMDMTVKEVYQAVEAMSHNLNTLQSRSGNQLPFTSINYGTCTLPEGRLVIKALLDCSLDGVGKLHRTSIFPCGIFQCMKGVNREPDSPNYDLYKLALKSTAQRLYPNYANVDWTNNAGYDRNDPSTYFSTMGKCKLQLM